MHERWIRSGEAREHRQDFGAAAAAYRRAAAAAGSPGERALARLGLARALDKAGSRSAAALIETRLLQEPPGVQDEYGIPIAFYAAHRLLAARAAQTTVEGVDDSTVDAMLRRALDDPLAPAALFMAREIAAHVMAISSSTAGRSDPSDLMRIADERIQDAHQALALQKAYPRNASAADEASARGPRWDLFGPDDRRWLVSTTTTGPPQDGSVIAIRLAGLQALLEELPAFTSAGITLVSGAPAGSEPLDARLPGLGLLFADTHAARFAREDRLLRWFAGSALLLVLTLVASGGYLFWRDVHRELRLAAMRSAFVSSVSHELKTPLTAIRMFAETLLMRGAQAPSHVQHDYLQTIVDETERLSRLIGNVLELSHIEHGQKTYRAGPAALAHDRFVGGEAARLPARAAGLRAARLG